MNSRTLASRTTRGALAAPVFASWLPAPLPIACTALFLPFASANGTLKRRTMRREAQTHHQSSRTCCHELFPQDPDVFARSSRHRRMHMKLTWTSSLHEASRFLGARAYARARPIDQWPRPHFSKETGRCIKDSKFSTRRRATLFRPFVRRAPAPICAHGDRTLFIPDPNRIATKELPTPRARGPH